MSNVLAQFVDELVAGRIQVIDLTQPLNAETPVIGLPPIFGASPGLTIEEISRYDDQGPAWYWNTLHLGEHTGTHFDAPVHWITGKDLPDNTTDTIPVRRFVGPACVIDVSAESSADPDFLLTPERIETWEAEHGRIPANAWVLLRTDWSKRTDVKEFFNEDASGPHTPGFHKSASEFSRMSGTCSVSASRRSARTRGRRAASTHLSRITRRCTARGSSASPASATSISCPQPAQS